MTEQTEQRLAFLAGLGVGSRVSTKKYGPGTIIKRSATEKVRPWLIRYDIPNCLEWVDLKFVGAEGEYPPPKPWKAGKEKEDAKAEN